MNAGERDELIVQMKLIQLRDTKTSVSTFGKIYRIGYPTEYKSLPSGFDLSKLETYPDTNLARFARSLGMTKASSLMKADTVINGKKISIKSYKKAPPAIVNHTSRPGFEFAAQNCGGNILALDKIIDEYWTLREKGLIAEDVANNHAMSPFAKNRAVLEPFLAYFLFKGTGSRLSSMPADALLAFADPLVTSTWSVYYPFNAVSLYWPKLIFSLRAKKGMPKGYPNVSAKMASKKGSIDKWTRLIDGQYRGALHIRVGR